MYPMAILAGGIATRMRPRTARIPKALLEVAGRPFVDHQLRLLRDQGVTEVVLCIGHLGEQIEAFVGRGDAWGLRVRYSHDGAVLLGTGGALRQALPLLGDTFFVMYGDSYLPCEFAAVQRAFETSAAEGLMTVFRNANAFGDSNVEFAGGRIVRYDKAGHDRALQHIDYGLAVLTAQAFAAFPPDSPFDLAQVFRALLAQGALAGLEIQDRFYEIGSPQGLRDTETFLLSRPALS